MHIILDTKDKSVIKIERGEDCVSVLKSLAKERDRSFTFTIIGACSLVELSYYDLAKKEYFSKVFNQENIEIVSVLGNVAWHTEGPLLHAHGVFSDESYKTFGGHINRLIVSVTGEVIIDWLPEKVYKKYDEHTGLNLLSAN
ncbi:MAG: PPC domain-containing DNA-binding protein [bacterium]